MEGQTKDPTRAKALRRLLQSVIAVALLCGAVWAITQWTRRADKPASSDDPRLASNVPARNVRPDVAYIGDAACARCHPEQAATYRQHPMGRSLAPVADSEDLLPYNSRSHNPFDAAGFRFAVERRGRQLFHKEMRGPQGSPSAISFDSEMQYVIGSGTRAHSYLIDHDGYLFQSAITWYAQKAVWDLSPGFAANPHSDRPVTAECLFCHCNFANAVEGTVNRFRGPLFRGYAIGCERCHGPGALHAEARAGAAPDSEQDTIVNPAHLPPQLRDAVCEQCHLQGEKRVLRRGRQVFDYRPGLPLQAFWSVFVRPSEFTDNHKAVGQVEQLAVSRCSQASRGKLGCNSCHDPHALPTPSDKVDYYRRRCLTCHTETSCAVAPPARRQKNGADDCISCHMPRLPSSDVAHTAMTDHRIRRRSDATTTLTGSSTEERWPQTSENPLHSFYPEKDPRDRGIALVKLAEFQAHDARTRERLAGLALPLLEQAAHSLPADAAAQQARAHALALLGRKDTALAVLEDVLIGSPEHEEAVISAAALAGQLGRTELALQYWERAAAVNPWSARVHYERARLLVLRQQWPEAEQEYRTVLRLQPFHFEAREALVVCLLQRGNKQSARAELDRLLSLNPPNRQQLAVRFQKQVGSMP
jgi:Flp pilus assembly protein TadD